MRKLTILFFLMLSLSLSSLAVPQASYALDEAKAMIFIQKEHPESLSRSSRVFKQVLAEITEVLQQDYDMDIVGYPITRRTTQSSATVIRIYSSRNIL